MGLLECLQYADSGRERHLREGAWLSEAEDRGKEIALVGSGALGPQTEARPPGANWMRDALSGKAIPHDVEGLSACGTSRHAVRKSTTPSGGIPPGLAVILDLEEEQALSTGTVRQVTHTTGR
jgi:hypothetical protein